MGKRIGHFLTIFSLIILSFFSIESSIFSDTSALQTGTIQLDSNVYPIPWGDLNNFGGTTGTSDTNGFAIFPKHSTSISGIVDMDDEILSRGYLTIHVQVNDTDFNHSVTSEDVIAQNMNTSTPPVKIKILRENKVVTLGYAGGDIVKSGLIDVGDNNEDFSTIRQFGPMKEISPNSGIFEIDINIAYTDGPASGKCPTTIFEGNIEGEVGVETDRFDERSPVGENFCILQGDIITVEYTDPNNPLGISNTNTGSATFALRNGVLQSDRAVYIKDSELQLTLIEPDFNLDTKLIESYDLDLIEWNSEAAKLTFGERGGEMTIFNPNPVSWTETGENTAIFTTIIKVPKFIHGNTIERGEEVEFEYTDWGPSGADFVGDKDEDINLTIFISNYGATVELDKKVYSWTDKVFITIVAPDFNPNSELINEIGAIEEPITISTKAASLENYKLVEIGTDTGIFYGEVILTGFHTHDADGDGKIGDTKGITSGSGPTDGFLATSDTDGVTVSFQFDEDETVVGSALIRWNVGRVQWLETSYPATGTSVLSVIDPDMNLNPESIDMINVKIWSDTDAEGTEITLFETNEATGEFKGTVVFTNLDETKGHKLKVSEGDTITAKYSDHTLPDPYDRTRDLDIKAKTVIFPPEGTSPKFTFSMNAGTDNLPIEVGEEDEMNITIIKQGQDKRVITLNCSGLPEKNAGCIIDKPSFLLENDVETVKVRIKTFEEIPLESYTVTITGKTLDEPFFEAVTNFNIIIQKSVPSEFDFDIWLEEPVITVQEARTPESSVLNIGLTSGIAQPVLLSCEIISMDIQADCYFNESELIPDDFTIVNLDIHNTGISGKYIAEIKAKTDGMNPKDLAFTVNVIPKSIWETIQGPLGIFVTLGLLLLGIWEFKTKFFRKKLLSEKPQK